MACNRTKVIAMWHKYKKAGFNRVVRLALLLTCSIIVIVQLSECFRKLSHPPISTNIDILLNNSLTYPAVTICRNPSYKSEVLLKYNLSYEIRHTSAWSNFPFDEVPLEQLFGEATYTFGEIIDQYALASVRESVLTEENLFFLSGRCQTFKPLNETSAAGKDFGYTFVLNHGSTDSYFHGDHNLGWNVYIHEPSENWTENGMQEAGRQESIFLEVGEELHIKMAASEFKTLSRHNNPCNNSNAYSITRCEGLCHWKDLAKEVGCSAPWLHGVNLPFCTTYPKYRKLMLGYLTSTCSRPCCGCIRPCNVKQYSTFLINRKPFDMTSNQNLSKLHLFYTSKMMTSIAERFAYDWSLFIADLGGSLGFLLGLSVVGAVNIFEKLIDLAVDHMNNRANVNTNAKVNEGL